MKANFALSLSFDGIRLLHRAAGGWRSVGEVSLTDDDLALSLRTLRQKADALEPDGIRTKLIIPDNQIRYLTIGTHAADDDTRQAAALRALDGATPYDVADLAFDTSPDGDRTHIAAVARETLAEAEAFAVDHDFNPVSTVAVPKAAEFLGEPFFGPTDYSNALLSDGDKVEPDGIAVVILTDSVAADGPVAVVEAAAPEVEAQEDTVISDLPEIGPEITSVTSQGALKNEDDIPEEPTVISDLPVLDEKTVLSDLPDVETEDLAPEPEDTTVVSDLPDIAETPPPEDPVQPDEVEEPTLISELPPIAPTPATQMAEAEVPLIGFASRRSSGTPNTPGLGGVSRDAPALAPREAVLAPSIPLEADNTPAPTGADTPATAVVARETAGPTAPFTGFLSRRKAPTPEDPDPGPLDDLPSSRKTLPPHRVPKPTSERQGMTIFGARKQEPEMVIGGKPRFLGLMLTVVLLVFLAGMAAWASVFMDEGLSKLFSPRQLDEPVITQEQAPEPEVPATPVVTASLSQDLPAPRPVPPRLEPVEADVFDPQKAEEFYAVTGIWTIPPEVPGAPAMIDLDNLYITSIDRRNLSFDAVALAAPTPYGSDEVITGPANPAPAGTAFVLDSRGLVIPTPSGALSPDGITVFLGRPPSVPPATPDRANRIPSIDAADTLRPELIAFRPKMRPDNLVEQTERSNLGGLSRSELAQYRPRMRPATAKTEEEADETPTAQAVAASPRPASRPRNFDRVVAKARQAPKPAPDSTETTTQVAAVAPRTVAPSIPSRASVAKQATVKNAINLRKVNLMGVFGTPSNRRALVRLSNGRYKKVQVGDRIDGGKVSAIGESELRYQKGGRNIVLKMPRI